LIVRRAGRWVAVNDVGEVLADADSFEGLYARITHKEISGVDVMRAAELSRPIVHGLG